MKKMSKTESNFNVVRLGVSVAVSALVSYLGELVVPIAVLMFVMIADYLTGIAKAYVKHELSSKVGIKGIVKKLAYLVMVAVGMTCDYLIALGLPKAELPFDFCVGMLVTVWLIINELISILENLSMLDVPIPEFLRKVIEKLGVRN